MRARTVLFLSLAASTAAAQQAPLTPVPIMEWKVPWEQSRPRDPFVDARGRVWFVGQVGNYVAYLEQRAGTFKRYELDAGVHPHNLVVDARGRVWYAGNAAAHIGRLDPATGKVTKFAMPDRAARDPHTLALGRDGALWFTVQGGNFVGRLDTASGRVRLVAMPTKDARPYGIVLDAQGRPWFDEFGTNKIGTIDPATMRLREYPLPNERTRPRRIALTSDGAVWYGDYTRGYLGRLDPATGKVREWPLPGGPLSMPYAMTVDDRDRLWVVETGMQPNRLVGFDPAAQRFFAITPIQPSGGLTVRHMIFHQPTQTIWFGTDAGTIAMAKVPVGTVP